jgi:hypothetical protein
MASTITAGNATNGLALSCDNTGILELKTGTGAGTTAMTIDASQVTSFAGATTSFTGNVGVGVTPSAWFSTYKAIETGSASLVYPGAATNTQLWNNLFVNTSGNVTYKTTGIGGMYSLGGGGNAHIWYSAPSGTAGTTATLTQAMTLDSSGNLLVGVASGTSHILSKNASSGYVAGIDNSGSTTPFGMYINFSAAAPNDTSRLFFSCADTSAARAQIRSNGGIANFSANNVNLSDRREKTNFAPAKNYLDVICAIPVQTFNYIDQNMEDDPGETLGVVAQDVQAVAPEMVMESNWGTEEEPKMRLSIYQTDLQYALMKCIQELKAELDATKAEVAALKGA